MLSRAGCRLPAAGCRLPAAGCRLPATVDVPTISAPGLKAERIEFAFRDNQKPGARLL